MNKTVTINLANIFFHIDEDAFLKLQRYLQAIKRSFTDSEGRDEIIADIEARIAEIFSETIKHERQVIGLQEVDNVIAVMGQPEDYQVDETFFEDETSEPHTTTAAKQLFRDTTTSYVGGVSAGLGHYLSIDPIWLRISWIFLTLFSGGGFVLIYIAFWIFVPEAISTADFLAMKGEAVNINSIERKIKEGFNDVADKVKDVNYQKYTNTIKNSSTTFFETLSKLFHTVLKLIGKLIGFLLMIAGGGMVIALCIALIVISIFGITEADMITKFYAVSHPNIPIWAVALIGFFLIGIPFFFLFLLGLKIITPSLKSIGTPAKLTLLAIWIAAIIAGIVLGVQQFTMQAYDADVTEKAATIAVTPSDTLHLKMVGNTRYIKYLRQRNDFSIKHDENGNKILVLKDIKLFIKENKKDTIAKLMIRKTAEGNSFDNAKERAANIQYTYEINGNTLYLDGYALTDYQNKYQDQEVEITLLLPEGITIVADENTSGYTGFWGYEDVISIHDKEGNHMQLIDGHFNCLDCKETDNTSASKASNKSNAIEELLNIDINEDNTKLKIDENGIEIKNDEIDIKIDENGLKIKTDN